MGDFSLDDELMERPATKKKVKSRRKARQAVSSDEDMSDKEQEEEEEEEEVEEEDIEDDEQPKKGAAMPLKKRMAMADAGGGSSGDELDDDDGYGSDLMGDDEDRRKLSAMTELEREMILAERAEKRDEMNERRERVREMKERQRLEEENQKRSSGRDTKSRAAAKKESAMRELQAIVGKKEKEKKKREKSRSRSQREESDEEYEGEDDDKEDEDEDDDKAEDDYEDRRRAVSSDEEAEEDEEDEEDEEEEATFEDTKGICVRRHTLEKWVGEPFFESTLPGCLVRVGVGNNDLGTPVYMLAEVVEVVEREADKAYRFGVQPEPGCAAPPRTTVKYIRVKRGKSERLLKMELVSSHRPSDKEFDKWVQVLRGDKMRVPSKPTVQAVRERLLAAENYQYTHEDIARMVAAKRQEKGMVRSLAYEKDRLVSIKEMAEQNDRLEEAAEAAQRLELLEAKEMEERLKTKRGDLGNINERNREVNWKNILRQKNWGGPSAIEREDGEGGKDTNDPFSRRPTRPTTYWKVDQRDAAAIEAAEAAKALPAIAVNSAAAEDSLASPSPRALAAATPGRWGQKKAMQHDVELSLDLSVLMPPPGGKRAGSERPATRFIGGVLPPNKRALTLTDYKRKQGIV